MNPFAQPGKILVSKRPQDMRAGVNRLAGIVTAEFGHDPMDGSLYVFVSRRADKCKMVRFDVNGWCLTCCSLCEGAFRWRHEEGGDMLEIEPRQLLWLLEGMEIEQPKAAKPVTERAIL